MHLAHNNNNAKTQNTWIVRVKTTTIENNKKTKFYTWFFQTVSECIPPTLSGEQSTH